MTTPNDVFQNEIMVHSGYVRHEAATLGFIGSCLENAGFQASNDRTWRRGSKTAVICLVDDVTAMFDINNLSPGDLIITDTLISRPCNATVLKLPDSWHGMYSYGPRSQHSIERDYSLLINRVDTVRIELMLALSEKIHLHQGIINFNCVIPDTWSEHDADQARSNFRAQWELTGPAFQDRYRRTYERLLPKMPFRNHDLTHDQALHSARLNIIVETYSGDDSVALSEKIFTALQLPRPWVVFGGRFAVQRLRYLGFDVLDDLVDHGYDIWTRVQAKTDRFVESVLNSIQDLTPHQERLQQAAMHNRSRLDQWRKDWSEDFANWLQNLAIRVK